MQNLIKFSFVIENNMISKNENNILTDKILT